MNAVNILYFENMTHVTDKITDITLKPESRINTRRHGYHSILVNRRVASFLGGGGLDGDGGIEKMDCRKQDNVIVHAC